MASAGDFMETDDPGSVKQFKTFLTISEVLSFASSNKESSASEFIKELLAKTGLSLAPISTEDQEKDFEGLKEIVRKRWNNLKRRWKFANYQWKNFKGEPDDIFLDIEKDYPSLVSYEECFSQQSGVSTSSKSSWLEDEVPVEKPLRRKQFDDMVPRSKRRVTEELYETLLDKAEELELEPEKLACYLGHRCTYQSNKILAKGFCELAEGSFGKKISLEKAIYTKTNLRLSKRGWTELRLLVKSDLRLPTTNEIRELTNELMPKMSKFEHGFCFEFSQAVCMTLGRLPPAAHTCIFEKVPNFNKVIATVTYGLDGSGSHRVYNSETSLAEGVDTSHILFAGFSLINLKTWDGTIIYEVPNPNSSDNERPIIICPGREDKELVKKALKHLQEGAQILAFSFGMMTGNRLVNWKVEAKMTQIDGKVRTTATGLGGAYCIMCTVSKEDAHNPRVIRQGFQIDRDMESIRETFELLKTFDDSIGEYVVPREANDYDTRAGLTQEPLFTEDIIDFSILHAPLRFLSFTVHFIYKLNGKVFKWGERMTEVEKANLKTAEKIFKEKVRRELSLIIDMPNPTGGGNSDTGNTAKRFFAYESRDKIIEMLNCTHHRKEAVRAFLQKASVILRIISCNKKINYEEFEKFCLECYLDFTSTFKWVILPNTVHSVLAHSAEKIRMNNGYGLKNFSEQQLEAAHKEVRKGRERSRKTSLDDNITDVMRFMWIKSDPLIRDERRRLHCSRCLGDDHTVRSCPETKVPEEPSEDDILFESFIED